MATASSGLTVTIALDSTSTGCSISSGIVSFTSPGTCVVDFTQPGNTNYSVGGELQQSITVNAFTQTVYATSSVSTAVGGTLPGGRLRPRRRRLRQHWERSPGEVAPTVDPTLTTALSTSGSTTSLKISALVSPISSGDSIVVTSGTHTQTFTASGGAAIGATSVSVTSQTANFAYPVGSDVNDTTHVAQSAPPTSGNGTATGQSKGFYATNTDGSAETAYVICGPSTLSTQTVYATSSVSTAVSAALCPAGDFALGGGGYDPTGTGGPHQEEVAPTVDPTLTTALSTSGSTTSLKISALVSPISSGDSIVVTSGDPHADVHGLRRRCDRGYQRVGDLTDRQLRLPGGI